MIIKLNGADFSANNIGVIQLQRIVSEETKALLANYSREFSKDQQMAVQDFIIGLKDDNIWNNIDNLYVPALASGIEEAFYNIKTGAIDFVPSSVYYEMESFGIRPVAGDTAVDASNIATATLGGSRMDYHFMVHVSHASFEDGNAWDLPIICNNGGVLAGLRMFRNIASNYFTISSYSSTALDIQKIPGENDISGFWGISSGQAKAFGMVNGYSDGQLNNVEADDTTFTGKLAYIGYQYTRKPMMQAGMRIISTGRYLDEALMGKYNDLCDALIYAIC